MSIGLKLKELREKRNLRQQEVADAIGVSVSMISMYEGNKKNPGRDTLVKLAIFFGLDINFFYDEEVEKLNKKDERDIAKTLEKVIMQLEDTDSDVTAYGGRIDESNREICKTTIRSALEVLKLINKEKYTPKKYKR